MGLFDFFKKNDEKPRAQQPQRKEEIKEESQSSEFERDIRELMNRPDLTCRADICEAEYQKGLRLMNNPTQDNVQRAYDIMGNLSAQFEYVPAILWMGDFMENAMQNYGQAVFWYKKAADLGDGNGARNYADMLMQGLGVQPNRQEAMKYYVMAANAGVPEALFVVGEQLRMNGDTQGALKAYQEAVNRGYSQAQIRINQLSRQ